MSNRTGGFVITLETLKAEVYSLHLSSEQEEKVMDIIETAYRIGDENGYDIAGRNYTPIILELMTHLQNEK